MDKFIVIDGLDGSGKDTQVKLLAEMYEKQGKNVVVRSHPSMDNKYGIKSKEALLKTCLLYTSPSPRDTERSRMPSSA